MLNSLRESDHGDDEVRGVKVDVDFGNLVYQLLEEGCTHGLK